MSDDSFYVPRAVKLPIMAVGIEEDGIFQGRTCYRLQGKRGIWRRVRRVGRGLEAGDGNTVCHEGKKLFEARPWFEVNDFLLDLCGVTDDDTNDE